MTIGQKLQEVREDAYNEGFIIGYKEGFKIGFREGCEEREEILQLLFKNPHLTNAEISMLTGSKIKYVDKLRQLINQSK